MRSAWLALMFIAASAGAAPEYRIETLAAGLNFPWSLAFLPDGSILVVERNGGLRMIANGELLDAPVAGVPQAYVAGQGGLFDVLPDPGFADNRLLYLSLAHGDADANATRVVRGRLENMSLTDAEVVFTAAPWKSTPHHYGGRMVFLPDGTLLLTIGDGFNYREQAQRLDSHLGKVVRITAAGDVPPDNPLVGVADAKPEIWTWGHRNPQGIVVLPDGVYLHEHGPRGGDELNRLEPGLNYGWPVIGYGVDYSGARISPYTEYPGMEQPLVYWVPSIAPAGMTFYDGELFPDWRGDLFIAALVEKSVRRIDLEGGAVVGQQILFDEAGVRIRDVRAAPDGSLYLLTDSAAGSILRVTPAE